MNSFLSFGTTFLSPGISRKFYSSWVIPTVKFSLLPNKVSVKMCFLHCMYVPPHSINYGSCIYLYTWISHMMYTLEDGVMNYLSRYPLEVWHIINCWTFVEWISEWRMKEGPSSSPCRMLSAWEKTQGRICGNQPGREVFPVRTPGTRAGFLWNTKEQSWGGIFDAEKNHSVTKSILGEEKPPVLTDVEKAEGTSSFKSHPFPSPGGLGARKTRNFPGWRRSFKDLTCRQRPLKMFKTDLHLCLQESHFWQITTF